MELRFEAGDACTNPVMHISLNISERSDGGMKMQIICGICEAHLSSFECVCCVCMFA